MNKRNLTVILVLALGIIFQTTFAFAQDSAKSKSSEEFTALKKGNFAFYLEFGSILFKTGSIGYYDYDEYYDWLLTAKYHLTDKTALRVSGGSIISGGSGVVNRYEYDTLYTSKPWGTSTSFNTTVNIQHFLSLKSKVKPFFSIGLYAIYSYRADSDYSYWGKTEEWGIGPYASFGAEIFVLDNISIIGEYILKGTIGKRYQKSWRTDIGVETYSYYTNYRLYLNSFKAGLSIYF